LDHAWLSPAGLNIYVSFVLKPRVAVSAFPQIPVICAIALHQALAGMAPSLSLGLKWPNDLLTVENHRKISGILCEGETMKDRSPAVVAGIGINVNSSLDDFSADLRTTATSLKMATGQSWNREQVLAAFLNSFETVFNEWQDAASLRPFMDYWNRHDLLSGQAIAIEQGQQIEEGVARGIDDEGRYYNKDRRRYFYRTKDGLDGHADFSLTQRSDIISLARFVERTDIEITGVTHHIDQLDTDETDSNRNRIRVDYYEGDIYFLFGDPTDHVFYDWYSHGDHAGVYVATDEGWRKLLYTPGRGYVGKDGELEFVDNEHFYSNYKLEASGKKFQYVGNVHHSLSVLVERRKKEKED
jgi:biotin-[acetyl-CoA-carboxylase] ligase BirA-like protein